MAPDGGLLASSAETSVADAGGYWGVGFATPQLLFLAQLLTVGDGAGVTSGYVLAPLDAPPALPVPVSSNLLLGVWTGTVLDQLFEDNLTLEFSADGGFSAIGISDSSGLIGRNPCTRDETDTLLGSYEPAYPDGSVWLSAASFSISGSQTCCDDVTGQCAAIPLSGNQVGLEVFIHVELSAGGSALNVDVLGPQEQLPVDWYLLFPGSLTHLSETTP